MQALSHCEARPEVVRVLMTAAGLLGFYSGTKGTSDTDYSLGRRKSHPPMNRV